MRLGYKSFMGATLIELIVAIVIIALGLTGIISVMIYTTGKSADPLVRQQGIAIGEAYLEEILAKTYPETIPCQAPSGPRATFSNICDYDSIGNPIPVAVEDQYGNPIGDLANYQVSVDVTFNTLLGLGLDAARVDVKVTHNLLGEMIFTGYRTNH